MDGWKNPRQLLALAAALMTPGCASLPPDQGGAEIVSLVAERGRTVSEPAHADHLIAELVSQPLSPESAVRIALLNSPRLTAEYARAGLAGAAVYDAGRLSNPTLSAAVLDSNQPGAASQNTVAIAQSFTSLLLLPARSRFAEGELQRVQQAVGGAILDLAATVERACYVLTSAQQVVAMRETIAGAAQVSAQLAQRFFDAGNISRRDLALDQASATQARIELLNAQAEAERARTTLNQLMGFDADAPDWTVSARLTAPLAVEDELDALLPLAERSRLDLAAARKKVELLADAVGVTHRFRLLGEVRVGFEQERESDHSRLTGPTLSLELPLFNQGRGGVARAEAQLRQGEAELGELELAIVNALKLAHASVQNAKARARAYRDHLIPQREEVVARTQEQVNYMLEGPFDLLLAKQQEYDAYQGYLEAVRDYWLARTELAQAVGTTLPSSAQAPGEVLDVETLTRPRSAGSEHHRMESIDHSAHTAAFNPAPGDQP